MKLKRANQDYVCELCNSQIDKGQQYARKTITLGKMAIRCDPDRPIPDSSWEPYRVARPVCASCANPNQ